MALHPARINLGSEKNWPWADMPLRFTNSRVEHVIEHDAERFVECFVCPDCRWLFDQFEVGGEFAAAKCWTVRAFPTGGAGLCLLDVLCVIVRRRLSFPCQPYFGG